MFWHSTSKQHQYEFLEFGFKHSQTKYLFNMGETLPLRVIFAKPSLKQPNNNNPLYFFVFQLTVTPTLTGRYYPFNFNFNYSRIYLAYENVPYQHYFFCDYHILLRVIALLSVFWQINSLWPKSRNVTIIQNGVASAISNWYDFLSNRLSKHTDLCHASGRAVMLFFF